MSDDFLKISYQDLLRDPDLIDRVQRDARRYRAREMRRMLGVAWQALEHPQKSRTGKLRTASCG
jgi:hypothetical protein